MGLLPHEIDALLFAAKADLETVNNDIKNFAGDDEPLLSAIAKLEEMKTELSTR